MLLRYTQFIDRYDAAAFLWAARRGIVHANVAAWEWTEDLVQHDVLSTAAAAVARSAHADTATVSGSSFLLIPLLDMHQRAEFVLGIGGAMLCEIPLILNELRDTFHHFSQIVHMLPVVVLTARSDGRFDYASRRWYQVTGRSSGEVDVNESLRGAVGSGFPAFEEQWRRGIVAGEPFLFEFAMKTALVRKRWFELSASPAYEDGRLAKWVVTLNDIQDRVEARQQLSEGRRRAQSLAQLATVALEVELDHAEFIAAALRCACDALPSHWIMNVTVDGQRFVVSYPQDRAIEQRSLECHAQINGITATREAWFDEQPRPVLTVPLDINQPGRHRLIVAGAPGAVPFNDVDVAFVSEVAWRIESSLRHRLAYNREARVARVLQLAMLPLSLPRSAGVCFDVAYQPAEVDSLIGGDWYDAFELGDGRLAFSIGDVAGHGLDAAVIMGHVREILRAMAMQGASPAHALSETNEVVMRSGYGLITAFLGYIDPATLEVVYASAGHLPPLVVKAGGEVITLPLGGLILGGIHGARYDDRSMRLRDEDVLVLYTDGLIEHAHDPVEGERTLCAALQAWTALGRPHGAQQLVAGVLAGARVHDDVALMMVRRPALTRRAGQGEPLMRRRIPPASAAHSRS